MVGSVIAKTTVPKHLSTSNILKFSTLPFCAELRCWSSSAFCCLVSRVIPKQQTVHQSLDRGAGRFSSAVGMWGNDVSNTHFDDLITQIPHSHHFKMHPLASMKFHQTYSHESSWWFERTKHCGGKKTKENRIWLNGLSPRSREDPNTSPNFWPKSGLVAWTTEVLPLISAQKNKNRSPAHQPLKIWPYFSQFKKVQQQ
jgi:hypothetical protein